MCKQIEVLCQIENETAKKTSAGVFTTMLVKADYEQIRRAQLSRFERAAVVFIFVRFRSTISQKELVHLIGELIRDCISPAEKHNRQAKELNDKINFFVCPTSIMASKRTILKASVNGMNGKRHGKQ